MHFVPVRQTYDEDMMTSENMMKLATSDKLIWSQLGKIDAIKCYLRDPD